jgi:TRAP-type transport system periplasmic protein
MLEHLRASAIGMPPAQIYESLERGALDGVATTWDLGGAIRLNEVLRHHTDARVYVAAFYIAMNRESYDSLPAEVQQAIDETTGDNWLPQFGPLWDKWDASGKADAEGRGNNVITIDDATRDEWRAELDPMIDEYLDSLRAEGVEDPHGLYEEMAALIAQHGG